MRLRPGRMAPPFNAVDLYGRRVSLLEYANVRVLLSFFRAAVCPLCNLRLAQLNVLKLNDSESALEVVRGAKETLWSLRPTIFVAVRDAEMLQDLCKYLMDFSYACWRMETALFNRQNFNRRDDDIFAGRAALALLAVPEERGTSDVYPGCTRLG